MGRTAATMQIAAPATIPSGIPSDQCSGMASCASEAEAMAGQRQTGGAVTAALDHHPPVGHSAQ